MTSFTMVVIMGVLMILGGISLLATPLSTFIGAGEHMIIDQLRECGKQVILVINKIDTVSGEDLKSFIDAYKKEMEYADIVTVSALKSDNLDELMQRLQLLCRRFGIAFLIVFYTCGA